MCNPKIFCYFALLLQLVYCNHLFAMSFLKALSEELTAGVSKGDSEDHFKERLRKGVDAEDKTMMQEALFWEVQSIMTIAEKQDIINRLASKGAFGLLKDFLSVGNFVGCDFDVPCQRNITKHSNQAIYQVRQQYGHDSYIGETVLHFATRTGDHRLVKQLLLNDASTDTLNGNGVTALYLATEREEDGMVAELLRKGAEANRGMDLPLFIATRKGLVGIVRLLVEAGAHLDVENKTGETPLAIAIANGYISIAQIFLEKVGPVSATEHQIILTHFTKSGHSNGGCLKFLATLIKKGLNLQALKPHLITLVKNKKLHCLVDRILMFQVLGRVVIGNKN